MHLRRLSPVGLVDASFVKSIEYARSTAKATSAAPIAGHYSTCHATTGLLLFERRFHYLGSHQASWWSIERHRVHHWQYQVEPTEIKRQQAQGPLTTIWCSESSRDVWPEAPHRPAENFNQYAHIRVDASDAPDVFPEQVRACVVPRCVRMRNPSAPLGIPIPRLAPWQSAPWVALAAYLLPAIGV
jgi:hypothetical protein